MHTDTQSVAGAGVQEGSSDVTQSEVGGAREPADQTQSSPGDARASVEELQLTPAGTLVLEGAESQAAAGAVNEMQAIRAKLIVLQSSVELLKTELESMHESIGVVTDSIDEIKTALNQEAYAAANAAEADEPAEDCAERQHSHADRIDAVEAELKAIKEQLGTAVRLGLVREQREHEIDERKERNGSRGRQCLELLAAQVEALGGNRTVNLVRNTLDGVAAGG